MISTRGPAPGSSAKLRTILVIGANRGIGLELIRTFAANGWRTIGSVRPQTLLENDPSVEKVMALGNTLGTGIVEIDYLQEDTIIAAAKILDGTDLDVLVNCAGVKPRPLDWDAHSQAGLMEQFLVMPVGYHLACIHFINHLSAGSGGKIINISSGDASIGDPKHDGMASGYRMAKAAVNQGTKTLAVEYKKKGIPVTTLAIDPGFIETRLTEFHGEIDIKESSVGMYKLIEDLTPEKSGSFYSWSGKELPW
ncbi:hypothetical protein O1611_g1872 [Lasiodiplodia mahajangana]|uniref:Uncharacterized protein n=1 Tax=Lasiodiplodia mahajangana TaxID=1108764 RepID=A0ACC2JWB9_9PEZI|nr:hypothetical protein O1611_g1872 [Lasiodiplodia mahajangana]